MAVVIAGVLFGAHARATGMRDAFCTTPDELAEVMPGVRLTALSVLNTSSDVRTNFVASMLYSQHGLGDSGFYYAASLILGGLGIPISEQNLWLMTGAANGLLIGVAGWLLWLTTRSRASVAAVVLIMAVSHFYVFTSQSGWGGRLTLVPLVQALLLVLLWLAVTGRPSRWLLGALFLVSAVLMHTDGFFFAAIVLAFMVLLQNGSWMARIRTVVTGRVFWAVSAGVVISVAVGIGLAVLAAQRGTRLTLYRHAFLHTDGGVIPSLDVIRVWIQTFQWYFPHAAYFWIVLAACVLAFWRGRNNPFVATLGLWWLLVGATLVSYTTGLTAPGETPLLLGWANGPYHLALPSYLLIAWACGHLAEQRAAWTKAAGVLLVAVVAVPLAFQTWSGQAASMASLRRGYYETHRADCQVVKAAAYYVRQTGTPESTVFHLTNEQFLGYFGEFYYGLSYSGNLRTGERNRLFDFGEHAVGRKTPPEEFARAYGIPHFDFYVEFLSESDPLALQSVERLRASGARPVFEIRDRSRPIGRVWSYDRLDAGAMEFSQAAARWNEFATLDGLVQQPLTGTTYHFGHSWIIPN
jgi:hypothetical protein